MLLNTFNISLKQELIPHQFCVILFMGVSTSWRIEKGNNSMKQQVNRVKRVISQTAKVPVAELLNKLSKVTDAGYETILDASNMVQSRVSRVGSIIKVNLPDLDLKRVEWVVPATVVGNLTAAVPCMLKDLPTVTKSLANRAGGIAPDKLFDLIPTGVKLKEESIVEFLRIHDVSHRISIKNAPTKAGDIDNVIFEIVSRNRVRGSTNMTRTEFQSAKFNKTITGIKCGFKTAVGSVAKGVLFGALLEMPITCIENALHVRNNRKSVKDARMDAVKDISISAGFAGATAAAFTSLSLLGVTLAPVAAPLVIVGSAVYTWSATDRIWKALGNTTKKKLMNSNPVFFLTSVAHREDERNDMFVLKMLPE